jgi:hypothetical protein
MHGNSTNGATIVCRPLDTIVSTSVCKLLSGNCQERALHDRGAPYMVPAVVTSYPDVLVLCPVVSCMTLVLAQTTRYNCAPYSTLSSSNLSKPRVSLNLHFSCGPFTDTNLEHCVASHSSAGVHPHRALQKYMHEFHADRDHAMCNIQNRSIPAVQLTQLRKLSIKNFQGTGVLKSSQSCQVLQCKVAARQWRCLAEIVSFSGSCSRCLVLSPLPCPTLPK